MAKKINIQGLTDIDDPFYRYTMTKLNVTRQKNKTIIDNLETVSKDIERDPEHITKYFKKKFSVSMNYKDSLLTTTANLTYHDFESALREYIQSYVLCERCNLPETNIVDNVLVCRCCSHETRLKKA